MFCMITRVECARVVVPGFPLAPCPLTRDARGLVLAAGQCHFECEEDWQEGEEPMPASITHLNEADTEAFLSAPL